MLVVVLLAVVLSPVLGGVGFVWLQNRKHNGKNDSHYEDALEILWQIKVGKSSHLSVSDKILDCCQRARQRLLTESGGLKNVQITAITARFSAGIVEAVYGLGTLESKARTEEEASVPDVVLVTSEFIGRRLGLSLSDSSKQGRDRGHIQVEIAAE